MSADNLFIFGSETAPNPPRLLHAGPLSLLYDQGDLRYVKLGQKEVIRRLYAAVRDEHWGTVPGRLHDFRISASESAFSISFRCEHHRGDIHFVWEAEISGQADGTLRFSFDGVAQTTFLKNRIGLCVLHPLQECAGAACRARHADGSEAQLAFPRLIAAEQPVTGLENLVGLSHELAPEVWIEFEFSGDLFETEDQRNWIDASFKTFSTPLRLPRPVRIEAGTRIRQQIEVRLVGKVPAIPVDSHEPPPPVLIARSCDNVPLPDLGLGIAQSRQPLAPKELARLSALAVTHLRADARLLNSDWRARLAEATRDANELGLPLELAVHWSPKADPQALTHLRLELTRRRADVIRVIALAAGEKSSTEAAWTAVRSSLGDLEVPIGVGTDGDLYQLNSQRPPKGADFICWSMNPQVHAFDNASLAETPEGASEQVISVGQYFPDIPKVISPITLKPRFRSAAEELGPPALAQLPPDVDPRQLSLFGAAWTVAMLASLAPRGVESLTFFETTGWCGVMESLLGSPLPEQFPSQPEQVFPIWHVFAALQGYRTIATTAVSEPLRIATLVISDRSGRERWLVANLSPDVVSVRLAEVGQVSARVLDGSNVARACRCPEAFWKEPAKAISPIFELLPHALAIIDIETTQQPGRILQGQPR